MSEEGITVKKEENFSEWFTQVLTKSELIEYSSVSGCYILRPRAYLMWEKAQRYFDGKIKKMGVKNTYFPLLIPERLLKKEAEHVEGFAPEVAWVTHSGETKLNERLAIRPTSETIMYEAFAKWIRSYKDLPLKINQWCNVIRWEFNNPVPFLRSREFLWQEGHTVFSSREEAVNESKTILALYKQMFEEVMAVPVIEGKKTDKEKFAGAEFTLSVETFLPTGKAIQAATSHHLGQNFAKAFGIKFTNENEEKEFAHQNSWGFSTRSIGMMIIMHSDNKGLVIPPLLVQEKVVIIPILFEGTKAKVMKKCLELEKKLSKFLPILDDRAEVSPGRKFNECELKGIPIRVEVGPKDLENGHAMVVRRDTGEKTAVKFNSLEKEVGKQLEQMQKDLFEKAKLFLNSSIVEVKDMKELIKTIKNKKVAQICWCGNVECEEKIKDKTGGAKSLNIPFNLKVKNKCVYCEKEAKSVVNFAKSY